MRMRTTVAFLSVIVYVCYDTASGVAVPALTQPSTRCQCAPASWEGKVVKGQGVNVRGVGHSATQVMRFSLDSNLKKIAASGTWYFDNRQGKFQVLEDYSKGVKYWVRDGSCTKSKLDKELWPNCAPKVSKYLSTTKLGFGEDSIDVDNYVVQINDIGMKGEQNFQVTAKDCVPVGSSGVGVFHGAGLIGSQVVSDVSARIKDPTVFNVPSACQTAKEVDAEAEPSILYHAPLIGA